MIRTATTAVILTILGIIALAGSARAGGLFVTEFGTPSLGTAGAGAPAGNDDASTAIHNPAAMTRLDDHQLMMAGAGGISIIEFDPDSGSPVAGNDGGNQGGFFPIISSNYVHKLSDRWRLGLGFVSISGAVLDPDNNWVGRNEITESTLLSLTAVPTVAYRATDWLSVGAGPTITYGSLTYKLKTTLPGEPQVKLDGLDDFAAGFTVSALVEFCEQLRMGIAYNSEIELNLSGDLDIPLGITPSINLTLPLAQVVRWGIHWDVTDRVALLLSGDWEDWSTAESLPVSVGGGATALPLKFKDTWKGSIGLHYRLTDKWLLQTGFTYDTSALDDKDRTTAFPIDRQTRVAVGALYDRSEDVRIGMSFEWLNLGKAKVSTASVKGEYETNDIFFFGLNITWKKLPWSGKGTF